MPGRQRRYAQHIAPDFQTETTVKEEEMRDLARYTLETHRLREHLGMVTAGGVIEQLAAVGAASVPERGLSAPLEIALTVWPFPLEAAPRGALALLGYEPVAGFESAPEQRFVQASEGTRLSIVEAGSNLFTDRLIVRDFLRHTYEYSAEARKGSLELRPTEETSAEAKALLAEAQRWWVEVHGFSPVERVAHEFRDFTRPWFVSSGWALDLFLGRVTRVHHDVDVIIPRSAIWPVKHYLNARGWQFVLPLDGRLEPWPPESAQKPDIQMHAHREGNIIDILPTEMDAHLWHYRRDPRITCPASQAFRHTETGLPYLAPELVLLFKSKNTSQNQGARPHDEGDFERALPSLDVQQRTWLRGALERLDPQHGWLERLR